MIIVNIVYKKASMGYLGWGLRLNAVSCMIFGILFLTNAQAVANFLDVEANNFCVRAVFILGAILLLNACHLLFVSFQKHIKPIEIYYFAAGDLLWVTATLALVAWPLCITTSHGKFSATIVAVMVGCLGVLQLFYLQKTQAINSYDDHLPETLTTTQAVIQSWKSMKTWVKIWLFFLNALFIAAAYFLPKPHSSIIFAAYVASGPWLLAIMVSQRGLTRFLGFAHLVPWMPLCFYLAYHALGNPRSSGYGWLVALLIAVSFCLLLDVVDIWRWFQGEKYRLGSKAAIRAKASN